MINSKIQVRMGIILIWFTHLSMDFMLGIWPVYKTLITIDLFTAGLIVSCGMLVGEGSQLYFGILSDRGFHRPLLALGIGLTAAIPLLTYMESPWLLFICILFAFIGSGAFHPAGSGLLVGLVPKQKNTLIALFASGGMLGAAFSQYIFMKVYHYFNGKTWILAIPIVVSALCCYFFNFPQVGNKSQKIDFKKIVKVIKPYQRELGILYAIQVCLQTVVLSFAFLLPEILQLKGYEEWFCLGGGYFYFILGAALTSIPISFCIDKFGYKPVLGTLIILGNIFLYTFLSINPLSVYPIICLLFLIGGTMGVIVPVIVSAGNSFVSPCASSFISAIYMGGASCIAGFGPMLASFMASFFTDNAPTSALQVLSSLFILALALMVFVPAKEQRQEDHLLEVNS